MPKDDLLLGGWSLWSEEQQKKCPMVYDCEGLDTHLLCSYAGYTELPNLSCLSFIICNLVKTETIYLLELPWSIIQFYIDNIGPVWHISDFQD